MNASVNVDAMNAPLARRCGAPSGGFCEFEGLGAFIDRSGLFKEVSIARCRNCGVGLSLPRIADVSALYADRSSQDFQPGTKGLARFVKETAFRRQARAMLAQLPAPPLRTIDFGCGSGLFTRCLGDCLRGAEVIGADFHDAPPAELADRAYKSIGALEDAVGSADLVLAMHVLEHDDDDSGLLARIMRLAKPGGRVIIEVPNIDCAWIKVFGRYWDAWYMPYHRTHYSRMSLRALITNGGWIIEREVDASVPTMGRTLANILGRSNSLAFILLGAALHPLQLIVEKITRQPSALQMIVRKPMASGDKPA